MPHFVFPILIKKRARLAASLPDCVKGLPYPGQESWRGKQQHKSMDVGRKAIPCQGPGSKGLCGETHPLT